MRAQYTLLILLSTMWALPAQAPTWPIDEAPPTMRPLIARADLMIAAMQDSVLRQLADPVVIATPELAMGSCHLDSFLTTQRLRKEGTRAGRTSDRLRNPANAPPAWAVDIIKANAGRRVHDVYGFAVDLGDKVGVLRPIAQGRACASCHGPATRLSPAVKGVLAQRYPFDKAVGFAPGEIRGWFWLELPRRER